MKLTVDQSIEKLKENNSIIASVSKVFKHGDMKHLTKAAYHFISGSVGFIAHYDIHGFRSEYHDVTSLALELVKLSGQNQWTNFRPGDESYQHMMNKKMMYNSITDIAKVYLEERGFFVPRTLCEWNFR